MRMQVEGKRHATCRYQVSNLTATQERLSGARGHSATAPSEDGRLRRAKDSRQEPLDSAYRRAQRRNEWFTLEVVIARSDPRFGGEVPVKRMTGPELFARLFIRFSRVTAIYTYDTIRY